MAAIDDYTVLEIVGDLFGRELARRDARLRTLESRPLPATLEVSEIAPPEKGDKGEPGDPGRQGDAGAGIDSPKWAAGIHRAGVLVQHHIGQHYRALKDTAAEPPHEDWERVGTGGFRIAGTWTEGRAFQDGDFFVRDFGRFHWHAGEAHLVSGRGAKGDKGDRGDAVKGDKGRDGRDGSRIEVLELRDASMVLVVRDGDSGELRDLSVNLLPHFEALAFAMQERIDQAERRALERIEREVTELRQQLANIRKGKP